MRLVSPYFLPLLLGAVLFGSTLEGFTQTAKWSSGKKAQITSRRVAVDTHYRSPRNASRASRKQTLYIVLHTTEGGVRGSLEKLSANGECHYVVDKSGKIYAIIDRNRIAYHAGTSMWEGRTGLDSCSIGIEIVGYHNQDLTAAQYASIKVLLEDLQRVYKISDERVLTHSMVAYGNPNRWQRKRHRGRKRCAMLLALSTTRAKLGLTRKPAFDPDVKAKRLVNADPELAKILYQTGPVQESETKLVTRTVAQTESTIIGPKRSAWDIARDLYNAPGTIYTFPDGTQKRGNEIRKWKSMPAGTKVTVATDMNENPSEGLLVIGSDGTAAELAGDEVHAASTFYFTPSCGLRYLAGNQVTPAQVAAFPAGTKLLVGYTVGGPISAKRRVFDICSVRWNRPETFYLTSDGKLMPGDQVNERTIPAGAFVFYRQ